MSFKSPEQPESIDTSFERERFIDEFKALIEAGKAGIGFSGKLAGAESTDYIARDLLGDFHAPQPTPHGVSTWAIMSGIENPLGHLDDFNRILRKQKEAEKEPSKVDEIIAVSKISLEKQEGFREEKRQVERKGFLGRTKRVEESVQVPNKVRTTLRLNEILGKGDNVEAYAICLAYTPNKGDVVGRPYRNTFVFVTSKAEVDKIFGNQSEPGGLLRKNPDLLLRLLGRLAPEMAMVDVALNKGDKRKALVVDDNFGQRPFNFTDGRDWLANNQAAKDVQRALQKNEVNDRIIEYEV